jgi:hypothetical protein
MPLTDDPNSPCLHEHDEDGMQHCYLILSEEERAKGFVRAVRTEYIHAYELGGCGAVTWMALPLAETYARDPHFYTGTWCGGCKTHLPVGAVRGEFYWLDPLTRMPTTEKVGT